MEKIKNYLILVAKVASFISLVMSVVIKTRMLLGLSNDVSKKKAEFLKKKEEHTPRTDTPEPSFGPRIALRLLHALRNVLDAAEFC